MADTAASFEAYRGHYAYMPDQGVEAEGVWSEVYYAAAMADPRTVTLRLKDGSAYPLLVPLGELPYMNQAYYGNLTGESPPRPAYYYSHLPALLASASDEALREFGVGLQRLAAERALVVYDYPALETDNRLIEGAIQRLGNVACRQLIQDDGPRHYHFVSTAELLIRPLNLTALFEQYVARGQLATGHVQVTDTLLEADIANVLGFYAKGHEALSSSDPVLAGFTESELRTILTDPHYTKVAYRGNEGQILNLSIVASLDDCPWLNRTYFEQHFPEQTAAGRVICGIGTITDPDHPRQYAPSVLTLGMVARLVALAGGRSVFVFVTDEVSRDYSPQLAQRAMRDASLAVQFQLVSEHVFRAVQLEQIHEAPRARPSLIGRIARGRAKS